MKKVALLIALMTIVAFTAFAADIEVKVTGKAELAFGMNLENTTTGFAKSTEQDITFTLVSGSSEKGAEEDVYGIVKVSGWGVTYDSDNQTGDDNGWASVDEGDLSAKIMFPMGWVDILSTNNGFGFINVVQDDDADTGTTDAGYNASLTANAGCVLGLNLKPAVIEIGVFSEDGIDVDNNYGASLKVTVDAAPIKVEVGGVMGINHSITAILFGGKLTASNLGPLTIYAGADASANAGTVTLEYGAGLALAIAGIKLNGDLSANQGIDGMDLRVVLDGSGLVANLGLTLTFELFNIDGAVGADLDADAEYSVAASVSYNAGKIKPYVNVRYGTFTVSDNAYTYVAAGSEPFKLNIGFELYLITNVTFVLDYNSDDIANNNGTVKFVTKMSL